MSSTLTKNSNTLVHHGESVKLRKCEYTGHATTIYSVDHAISVLDEIGELFNSDDSLPFALRLVEGSELIQLADDNGEFGASQIISSCLGKLDGYNILVAVTLKIYGCFNPDMVQNRKLPVIRTAALNAIESLRNHLENRNTESESTIGETLPDQQRLQNSQQPPLVPFARGKSTVSALGAAEPQRQPQPQDNGENLRFDSQVSFTETDLQVGEASQRGCEVKDFTGEPDLSLNLDHNVTPGASPAQQQSQTKRPVDPLGAAVGGNIGKKQGSKTKFGAKLPRAPTK